MSSVGLVLEIEISCSQWEGSACTQSALIYFLLSFGLAGAFFLCSQHVNFKFPMDSHEVPNMFSKSVPNRISL
jgi:hypothetical protein